MERGKAGVAYLMPRPDNQGSCVRSAGGQVSTTPISMPPTWRLGPTGYNLTKHNNKNTIFIINTINYTKNNNIHDTNNTIFYINNFDPSKNNNIHSTNNTIFNINTINYTKNNNIYNTKILFFLY